MDNKMSSFLFVFLIDNKYFNGLKISLQILSIKALKMLDLEKTQTILLSTWKVSG